jgi:hypothetical protein
MFNIKVLLIAASLGFMFLGPAFGQALPVCNETSALAWGMNTEADMAKYTLYHGPSSGLIIGGEGVAAIDIPHDPSTAIDNGDGTFTVVHRIALPEGDTFLALTATDQSDNQTPLSNEVGCKINMTPQTPTIELRFNLP